MKRILAIVLVFFSLFIYNVNICVASPPETAARGAVVMDAASGRILYAKNPHVRMPMASTTKIMTAILAIENGNPNDIVTASDRAYGVEGSSIWLGRGEKMTLENLLYGLMLQSGNDAAVAIAEHIGGSVKGFVDLMNRKAMEIGAKNTHFNNPNGLPDNNHYTTAYDLALISAYAMHNPVFRTIVSTKYKQIPWEGHEWNRVLKNNNDILWSYEGGNGIKTGYTRAARRCLASAAFRNNMQLVCIVLNCQPWFEDSMALMDYCFKEYKPYTVLKAGVPIAQVKVADGVQDKVTLHMKNDIILPVRQDEAGIIRTKIQSPKLLRAPLKAGAEIGNVEVSIGNDVIIKERLYISSNIEENTFLSNLKKIFRKWIFYDVRF